MVYRFCKILSFRASEITILAVKIPQMPVESVVVMYIAAAIRTYGYIFYHIFERICAYISHTIKYPLRSGIDSQLRAYRIIGV